MNEKEDPTSRSLRVELDWTGLQLGGSSVGVTVPGNLMSSDVILEGGFY